MGLRERKRARTAEAIEAVALGLFRANGYAATTVDDIAEAADVSRATVFRYFPSKEDILFASYPAATERLREICAERRGTGSYGATVRRTITAFANELVADDDEMRLRASIIGDDQRLLGRSLLVEHEWAQIIVTELGDAQPTLSQHVLASAAMTAARAAMRHWNAMESGDFAMCLSDALDALRLPKR